MAERDKIEPGVAVDDDYDEELDEEPAARRERRAARALEARVAADPSFMGLTRAADDDERARRIAYRHKLALAVVQLSAAEAAAKQAREFEELRERARAVRERAHARRVVARPRSSSRGSSSWSRSTRTRRRSTPRAA